MLASRLQAIDADCERDAKIELAELSENVQDSGSSFRLPSPQAVEAVWLKLIGRKERAFIEEIDQALKEKPPGLEVRAADAGSDDMPHIKVLVSELLADERYVDRMQDFYREANRGTSRSDPGKPGESGQRGLIEEAYRTGVMAALRKARHNVLVHIESHQPQDSEDLSFSSQWKRYSTLSPWRLIWTIVLLSLTSYLIAFIMATEVFRGFLERMGWSTGTGL